MEHGSSPTNYPGRTPIQIVERLLFSVFILAAGRTRTSNQVFKESGSSPTSPPRRTYSSLASVSAETTFYWACDFHLSLSRKFPFHKRRIENHYAAERPLVERVFALRPKSDRCMLRIFFKALALEFVAASVTC